MPPRSPIPHNCQKKCKEHDNKEQPQELIQHNIKHHKGKNQGSAAVMDLSTKKTSEYNLFSKKESLILSPIKESINNNSTPKNIRSLSKKKDIPLNAKNNNHSPKKKTLNKKIDRYCKSEIPQDYSEKKIKIQETIVKYEKNLSKKSDSLSFCENDHVEANNNSAFRVGEGDALMSLIHRDIHQSDEGDYTLEHMNIELSPLKSNNYTSGIGIGEDNLLAKEVSHQEMPCYLENSKSYMMNRSHIHNLSLQGTEDRNFSPDSPKIPVITDEMMKEMSHNNKNPLVNHQIYIDDYPEKQTMGNDNELKNQEPSYISQKSELSQNHNSNHRVNISRYNNYQEIEYNEEFPKKQLNLDNDSHHDSSLKNSRGSAFHHSNISENHNSRKKEKINNDNQDQSVRSIEESITEEEKEDMKYTVLHQEQKRKQSPEESQKNIKYCQNSIIQETQREEYGTSQDNNSQEVKKDSIQSIKSIQDEKKNTQGSFKNHSIVDQSKIKESVTFSNIPWANQKKSIGNYSYMQDLSVHDDSSDRISLKVDEKAVAKKKFIPEYCQKYEEEKNNIIDNAYDKKNIDFSLYSRNNTTLITNSDRNYQYHTYLIPGLNNTTHGTPPCIPPYQYNTLTLTNNISRHLRTNTQTSQYLEKNNIGELLYDNKDIIPDTLSEIKQYNILSMKTGGKNREKGELSFGMANKELKKISPPKEESYLSVKKNALGTNEIKNLSDKKNFLYTPTTTTRDSLKDNSLQSSGHDKKKSMSSVAESSDAISNLTNSLIEEGKQLIIAQNNNIKLTINLSNSSHGYDHMKILLPTMIQLLEVARRTTKKFSKKNNQSSSLNSQSFSSTEKLTEQILKNLEKEKKKKNDSLKSEIYQITLFGHVITTLEKKDKNSSSAWEKEWIDKKAMDIIIGIVNGVSSFIFY